MKKNKITVKDILQKKSLKQKITMLTAYDYPMALLFDEAGVDAILVGDSLGNVVLGQDSTVSVTMDDMLHHTKAVSRAVNNALVIGDMPFMSYNISVKSTIENAGKFLKQAGADVVKMEGATPKILKMIESVTGASIQVIGHLGLTPQTAGVLGGFKVQGKMARQAKEILDQAIALEKAGCFAIVLECIPEALADIITKRLKIPTIGIGAGKKCDGQVLVGHDMLGLNEKFSPKFVKKYANLAQIIKKAAGQYVKDVRSSNFPSKKYSFSMDKEQLKDIGL